MGNRRIVLKAGACLAAALLLSSARAEVGGQCRVQLAEPLEWLYPDSRVGDLPAFFETDVPSNGVAEANILFNGLAANEPLAFACDAPGGEWFRLVPVPVEKNTGPEGCLENPAKGMTNLFVTRRAPFKVHDAMAPLAGRTLVPEAASVALRFRLRRFGGWKGSRDVQLSFVQGAFRTNLAFRVNVHAVAVPPVGKDSFKYTNWMDWYGAMRCHGVRSYWQDAHFETIRQYMRLAAYGRQNVMPLPLFLETDATGAQVPNEARYVRFVKMAQEEGFAYLEGPHFCVFTNGSWNARAFKVRTGTNVTTTIEGAAELGRLAGAFADMITRNGWRDIWYQHVADEPSKHNAAEYRITAGIMRKYMPGIKLIDAIELPELAGALDAYCPKNYRYEERKAQYERLRTRATDEMWCYTCLVPGGKWMNRLLDQEVLRALYLPWGCFVHGLDGYLHWGFNRYAPGKTPFDAGFSGDLPPGDRNIVYPGPDGPWPSVRLEAMRQGMEDLELLRLLKRRDAAGAAALCARVVRGFQDYANDPAAYRAARRDLLKALASGATRASTSSFDSSSPPPPSG